MAMGVVFLPLTSRIFSKFFDRGYAFSKTVAILVTSYLVWLLGSLKILPFGAAGIWLVVFVGIGANLYFFLRGAFISCHSEGEASTVPGEARRISTPERAFGRFRSLRMTGKGIWKIILFEEVLFLVCLVGWALVRGFLPDIHGLEKFMDHGFVETILRSRYFPPKNI